VRRENLHRLIDDQTEAIRRKELSRKKVREMERSSHFLFLNVFLFHIGYIIFKFIKSLEAKREADVILGEVRRKRNDTQRIGQLLQSLRDLRVLRARSLELGRALFSKQEDTDHFNSTLGKMFYFFLT
jgi:hypothetical protein